MDIFQAIVLGIVQGLSEFLPISSTGHLRIVPAFAGWDDPGAAFTAVIQLGTVAAVLLYFCADLIRVARAFLGSLRDPARRAEPDARMGWCLVVGTVPIAIFGFAFKDQIETGGRDLYLIAAALIVFSGVMVAAERVARRERKVDEISHRDGVLVGIAQAAALIPGVSRSGATISAGLALGFEREAAARFSFLLSIPAVVLSGLFELKGIATGDKHSDAGAAELIVATLLAFLTGYASIAFLLRFLVRHSIATFATYRVALGAAVLALLAAGAIS